MRANDKTGQPANDNEPCPKPMSTSRQRIDGIKSPATLATAAPANDNEVTTTAGRGGRSKRAALITQVVIERAIRAAKKTGAPEVEVKMGEASLRIPLIPNDSVADSKEIVL